MVVDAYSLRRLELAWLIAFGAELEQERAIDRRQYLHSMVVGIGDDDSMSVLIDRNAIQELELARLRSFGTDLEQEREIDRRQEHQSMIVGVDDDGVCRSQHLEGTGTCDLVIPSCRCTTRTIGCSMTIAVLDD